MCLKCLKREAISERKITRAPIVLNFHLVLRHKTLYCIINKNSRESFLCDAEFVKKKKTFCKLFFVKISSHK